MKYLLGVLLLYSQVTLAQKWVKIGNEFIYKGIKTYVDDEKGKKVSVKVKHFSIRITDIKISNKIKYVFLNNYFYSICIDRSVDYKPERLCLAIYNEYIYVVFFENFKKLKQKNSSTLLVKNKIEGMSFEKMFHLKPKISAKEEYKTSKYKNEYNPDKTEKEYVFVRTLKIKSKNFHEYFAEDGREFYNRSILYAQGSFINKYTFELFRSNQPFRLELQLLRIKRK